LVFAPCKYLSKIITPRDADGAYFCRGVYSHSNVYERLKGRDVGSIG
jgi:hypothetical protein